MLSGIFLFYLNANNRSILLFLCSILFTYLFIISWSVTKLEWYDLPLFPILSFFSGYTIYTLIKFLQKTYLGNTKYMYSFIVIVFAIPIYYTCRNSFKSEVPTNEKKYEALSEYAFHNQFNGGIDNTTFYTTYFDRPLYFYKYKLNTRNKDFKITDNIRHLKSNDTVILTEDSLLNEVQGNFHTQIVYHDRYITKIKLLE